MFLEIPVDLLAGRTDAPVGDLDTSPLPAPSPDENALAEAVRLLIAAETPVVWAGGGVLRAGAWDELRLVAERLGAPVATTYMGKGAFPEDDPLALGTAMDEPAFKELLSGADVVLAIGTELGAETTGHYELELSGTLVHADADPRRIGATYDAHGLVGDAKAVLAALAERLPDAPRVDGVARVAAVRKRIEENLGGQGRDTERGLLQTVRDALPRNAITAWDMTILAYWAAAHFPMYEPRTFLYPLGSGTLGYAWPAALGASLAAPGRKVLGGRRRRRLQLRHRRARRRQPVRTRREAPARRRRRLRDPARVSARPVRGDDQRRPGRARLPRPRRGLRRSRGFRPT